jgi:hypothetical protein
MNYKKFLIALLMVGTLASCAKKLDDLLVNPNSPDPNTADVDLYLNYVQLEFKNVYNEASDRGQELTRQSVMFGPIYSNAYAPNTFDGIWTNAYAELMKNANALIGLADAKGQYIQAGIARTLKAYVLATLVDDFGDVPYSEIDQGAANTNPTTDAGADVYAAAHQLLDSALLDFEAPNPAAGPENDLFYDGDETKWATLVKTLQLKLYMNERLTEASAKDKIAALISGNDLIDEPDGSEDFVFKYGTNISAPDTRHPRYVSNYTENGAGDYIGTHFLWAVGYEKGSRVDPRLRFYFYRQVINYDAVDDITCACASQARPSWFPAWMPYCLPVTLPATGGYWGRDHGDNSGIPPDNQLRTAWGIYPAGGKFDADQAEAISSISEGALGAGINPIWLASYTDFLKAEAVLALGISGNAKTLLEDGVRASIDKVINYPKSVGQDVEALYSNYYPAQTAIDKYANLVLADYDAAGSNDDKLNVVMKEYYIAAWGNGIEPYNNYRRTGKPDNLQLTAYSSNPGYFIRSFYYPAVFVDRNLNAPAQKTLGTAPEKVFWDNNPDDFIH